MQRAVLLLVLGLLTLVGFAGINELDVAKQALRDGLWEVARIHAGRVNSDEAKLIILESWASEEHWDEVKKSLENWKHPTNNVAFGYYDAVVNKDWQKALELLSKSGSSVGEAEAMMMRAELMRRSGDRKAASEIWRRVVAMTNVGERAYSVASMNLGEEEYLRRAYQQARQPRTIKALALRLGVVLLKKPTTASEGEKMILAVVSDSPDFNGAREAYVALAANHLSAKDYAGAEKLYSNALEIWPSAVRSSEIAEGRGECLLRLGRREEALQSLIVAEKCAENNNRRALAVLRQGDVLSALSRGEEAMAKYHEVMQKYPDTAVAKSLKQVVQIHELEMQGREKYREYRFKEAAEIFAQVAKEDSESSARMEFLNMLCLYGLGKDADAEQKARDLAKNSPNMSVRADAQLWLAKFLYNRGLWKESSRAFVVASEMKPTGMTSAQVLLWAARADLLADDYQQAIIHASMIIERYRSSKEESKALMVQCKALVELARFDEAVLVAERALLSAGLDSEEKIRLQILKADAYFAMGADNQARYQAAFDGYRKVWLESGLSSDLRLITAFKIGRSLEKLRRKDEAIDQLYTGVILAYRDGVVRGERFGDEAQSVFSRTALHLAEELEELGRESQAVDILRLVSVSGVHASAEVEKRIERILKKGRFL